MVKKEFRLCRIKGIDIHIHYSFVILFAWLTYMVVPFWESSMLSVLGKEIDPYVVATFFSVVFFANILVHEMAHALVSRRVGLPVTKIIFFLLGAGMALDEYFKNHKQEAKISSAGLIASTILALVWYGLYFFLKYFFGYNLFESGVQTFVFFLGYLNLWLVGINIIPAFPTDGGRLLRSFLWKKTGSLVKSTRIATGIAWVFSVIVISFIFTDYSGKYWYALVGVFIAGASFLELRQVETGLESEEIVKLYIDLVKKKLKEKRKKR